MERIYQARGRNRSTPVGKFLVDPLRKGKKLFQVYGIDNLKHFTSKNDEQKGKKVP